MQTPKDHHDNRPKSGAPWLTVSNRDRADWGKMALAAFPGRTLSDQYDDQQAVDDAFRTSIFDLLGDLLHLLRLEAGVDVGNLRGFLNEVLEDHDADFKAERAAVVEAYARLTEPTEDNDDSPHSYADVMCDICDLPARSCFCPHNLMDQPDR